jgi:lipopolysaccharide/colanic/teichoic acid biosynthesis glycosyltransferase
MAGIIGPALEPAGFEAAVFGDSDQFVDRPGYSPALAPTLTGGPSGGQAVAKRALDIAVALLLILLVAPVLIVAAVGVAVSSRGPLVFRQTRVGRGGQHFTMLKFRTFPHDHADVVHSLPNGACPLRWGRLLRRTSIDELPQLFNVLMGDMSLVGPRPERPRFAEEVARDLPSYRERHRAPVGITGLAQVRGLWGPTSIEARVAADNEYVDTWSFLSDMRILVLTVPALFRKSRG